MEKSTHFKPSYYVIHKIKICENECEISLILSPRKLIDEIMCCTAIQSVSYLMQKAFHLCSTFVFTLLKFFYKDQTSTHKIILVQCSQ